MLSEISIAIVTAVITGLVAAVGTSIITVIGLRIHVQYIKEAQNKNEKAIIRAHERIDEIHRKGCQHGGHQES